MTEEELLSRVTNYFADKDRAVTWMDHPKKSFGGRSPREMMRIDGGQEVIEEWLDKMEQGFIY
jgi:uncharacterized protein (DUF2384 family)